MAELASAYPTAGGLYYWASKMKNKNWGWWTAWLNLIGQFAIVAGIDYAAAGFINATIVDRITGGTFNTVEIIPGILNGQLVTMGVILAIQLTLNIAGINLVALLNQISVWWHIGIVAIVVVLIFLTGKPDQSGLTLFQIQPQDQAGSWNNNLGFLNLQYGPATSYPVIIAFFFSLLLANWTYTGYDASAHVAEETVGARMASAWGVFLSVAVSAVVGYIFLVALTTHLPNLSTLFPATLETPIQAGASQYYFGGGVAVIDILNYNLGQIGDVLAACIAIAMWFCGLAVARRGRPDALCLQPRRRDPGLGLAQAGRVTATGRPRTRWSRWPSWPGSSPLRRSSSGPGRRSSSSPRSARSSCTRRTASSSTSARRRLAGSNIASGASAGGRSPSPMSRSSGCSSSWCCSRSRPRATSRGRSWSGSSCCCVVYYFGWARARFEGPKVMGAEAELTDLEREFEHAAEELGGASPA